MSESFDLPDVERFTTGTVGPPGARIFYLQAAGPGQLVTLRLEKAQVVALAQYLADLLADMPPIGPGDLPADMELLEPVNPEWVVGQLGVALDEDRGHLIVRAEELVLEEEDGEDVGPPGLDPLGDAGVARFTLSPAQVAAFVGRAAAVVAAGRPPCPLCGRPLDADGHLCVKTNGHKSV